MFVPSALAVIMPASCFKSASPLERARCFYTQASNTNQEVLDLAFSKNQSYSMKTHESTEHDHSDVLLVFHSGPRRRFYDY